MEKKFVSEVTGFVSALRREFVRRGSSTLTKGAITIPQMILMEIVFEKGLCTMTDLARTIGITKSAVTGLTDRLMRSKLITRVRGIKDRRLVLISLTEKGKNVTKKLVRERDGLIKEAFGNLTQKERETYLNLIKKIHEGFARKRVE